MNFPIHSLQTAPEGSQSTLREIEKAYRFIPNLFGMLAESPLAVSAYAQLNGLIQSAATLTPQEQQVVMLSISGANGCKYCMAAHSAVAAMVQTPAATVAALRECALPENPRMAALVRFARQLVAERGWVKDEAVQAFVDAGFTRAQVLEVLVILAMKTLSNYANHLANTPLDPAFASQKWSCSCAH